MIIEFILEQILFSKSKYNLEEQNADLKLFAAQGLWNFLRDLQKIRF